MKLQFILDGSKDCPLIRLWDFEPAEALRLKQMFDSMALGSQTHISFHDQQGIETIVGCQLSLSVGKHDYGIAQMGPLVFECVLTAEGWADLAGLTEPFCSLTDGIPFNGSATTARSLCCYHLAEHGELRLEVAVPFE
jgi:hypothetical protein